MILNDYLLPCSAPHATTWTIATLSAARAGEILSPQFLLLLLAILRREFPSALQFLA